MSQSAAKLSFLAQITGESDVSSKVKSMGGAMRQFGSESEQASTKSEKVTGSTTKLIGSMKETTLSFTAAASSLTSLYFQYDNLEKVELRVQKAETSATSAKAGLIGAQEALNKLVADGVTSGPLYEQALLRRQAAEEKVQNASESLRLATGDLSQAQIQFAMTAVPTAISAATSLVSGLKNINFSALSARLGMIAAGGSAVASGAQFQLTGAMANVGAAGIRNVGTASKIAQLAMGPLGWVMLGIGAVLTLVATNAFGLRDAIYDLGKTIGDAIPGLRPFLDFLGQIGHFLFPEATDSAADYEVQIEKASAATGAFSGSMGQTGIAIKGAVGELQTYQDWLVKTEQATIATTTENLHYLGSLGEIENLASLTNQQIDLAAEFFKDQALEVQRSTAENFKLVASYEGVQTALALSNDELKKWADGLRLLKEQAKEAEDAIDKLQKKAGGSVAERAMAAGLIGKNAIQTGQRGSITSFIEHHATGGIVNEPTFMIGMQTGKLGIMGEIPEAIVPLGGRASGGLGPGGSAQTAVIHIHLDVDGRTLAQIVSKHQLEGI